MRKSTLRTIWRDTPTRNRVMFNNDSPYGYRVLDTEFDSFTIVDSHHYDTVERAYQYYKCKYLHESQLAEQIRKVPTLEEAKEVGKSVTQEQTQEWLQDDRRGALPTMLSLLMNRYAEYAEYRNALDNCVEHWQVPMYVSEDTFWGIGMKSRIQAREKQIWEFQGKNFLGRIMMLLLTEAWQLHRFRDTVWNNGNWGVVDLPSFPDKYDPGHEWYRRLGHQRPQGNYPPINEPKPGSNPLY